MADITIENNAYTLLSQVIPPRSLVWVSSTTGYIFFMNTSKELVYRKTTDGGSNWGNATSVTSDTVEKIAIWYDGWTNGDSGTQIHICWSEAPTDTITYVALDTSDDSTSSEVTVDSYASVLVSQSWNEGCLSIVKSRNGTVFVAGWADTSGEGDGFYKATMSGGVATSFTSKADVRDGSSVDNIMLLYGNETDEEDIYCVYYDVGVFEITLKTYDDSANSWSESSVIHEGTDGSITYFKFDCVQRFSDDHTLVAVWTRHDDSATPDPAIEFFDITNGSTWSQKTDVYASDNVYGIVGLMINQQNDDLYCAYTNGSTTGAIKYKVSTDGGTTWGTEQNMSETSDDHRIICGGTSVNDDGGRWMPVWFNDDLNDVVCNVGNSISIAAAGGGDEIQITITDAFTSISYPLTV